MKVTYLHDITKYRIIPVRFVDQQRVFSGGYSVQLNKRFLDLFDNWVTTHNYYTLEDAIKHVEHFTGEKFGV